MSVQSLVLLALVGSFVTASAAKNATEGDVQTSDNEEWYDAVLDEPLYLILGGAGVVVLLVAVAIGIAACRGDKERLITFADLNKVDIIDDETARGYDYTRFGSPAPPSGHTKMHARSPKALSPPIIRSM
ncbi:hypothetical protein DIPPA_11209 [Diplonema papillatum]|nr:hypothetical protein DIPPA_11209 [Diplonema papillatum]KAJ9460128.1 hypothetical protein DIPPA_11209 [Diplonema papillatum]